jgi:hypothetical protein
MDAKKILIFLFLTSQVSAIQDAYVTIDGRGFSYCLAVDSPDNYICSKNESLALDGISDHNLYFVPYTAIRQNSSMIDKINYGVLTPLNFVVGISLFLIMLLVGAIIIQFMLNLAGVRI